MWLDGREGGENLGGDREGETVIRMYCMKKNSFQLKKEKPW